MRAMRLCGLVLCVWVGCLFVGCGSGVHSGKVDFREGATIEEKCYEASRVVPTDKQLAWQRLELTAFVHFGMNTFTGREWGDGSDAVDLFHPEGIDTDQWVETLKRAGFKLVIITAKHHDGFCLWPTRTTDYSVAKCGWRNGEGDVVRMVQESCAKYGLKFGVYLSPWDRHADCYGSGKGYDDFFVAQLCELLTGYGKVDEVWFDGACGEGVDGRRQVYDFERYYAVIDSLQPDAVVAIMGDDVRWVGNENGMGRDTEWSVTPLQNEAREGGREENERLGINNLSSDLGSRYLLVGSKGVHWWPSEVDVSIRPRWFYNAKDDGRVKSLEQLVDIYFNSVGKNSVLLLNVPPNRDGRFAQVDSMRLCEFGDYLREMYSNDVIVNDKKWHGNVGVGERVYAIKEGAHFNVIELAEDITKGQRVERFSVWALRRGKWEQIANGTTIGYKRLLRVPLQETEQLKVVIDNSRGDFYIDHVRAYEMREFISMPIITRDKNGMVSIKSNPNASVHYTTDGTEPTLANTKYVASFPFAEKGVVRATAFFNGGEMASETAVCEFDYPKTLWRVVDVSDEERGYEAEMAIDSDDGSLWHTPWDGVVKKMPHYLVVDCGDVYDMVGFSFVPRSDGMVSGIPYRYSFYVSEDGEDWRCMVRRGEFENIKHNPLPQVVEFKECVRGRYFKFVVHEEVNAKSWVSVAEIGILTK